MRRIWIASLFALASCAAPSTSLRLPGAATPFADPALDRACDAPVTAAAAPLAIVDCPSPNRFPRRQAVSMIVLHYTGMADAASAVRRLRDPLAKVSCHYLVTERGVILRMVPEDLAAAHAGQSFWRGVSDVNQASIGIEIVNPGGGVPFTAAQMAAAAALVADISRRHGIARHNVVGHSDVAPSRKQDPGEAFDWPALARVGIALPPPSGALHDPNWSDSSFLIELNRFGYDVRDPDAAIRAFQRRFRPRLVDGRIDRQTRAILFALIGPAPSAPAPSKASTS